MGSNPTPSAAQSHFSALKRQNVEVAQGDMDVYLAAKAELVAGLLMQARAERELPPVNYWEPDATREDRGWNCAEKRECALADRTSVSAEAISLHGRQ